ncbi:unnamed protein product [Mytilus edulis]|uniref:Uncharacterized protein n=1 Tax=Mytilus edulis TaxID=6550 RepID=A0A8S3U6U0_MYTED|nr:unnamed protein product [Mytilus edulis]
MNTRTILRTSTSSISTFSSTTADIKTTIYPSNTKTIFTMSSRKQTDTTLTTYQENADSTSPGTPEITTSSAFGTDSLTTNKEKQKQTVMISTSTYSESTRSPTTGDITSKAEENAPYCSCIKCVLKNQTFLTESDPGNTVNLLNLRINKKDTNKYKRTKQSAFDSRKSSRYLGIGGIIVILLPVLFIISIDVLKFLVLF